MIIFLFFLLEFAAASKTACCQDQGLADECGEICLETYNACNDDCDSSICQLECLSSYSNCLADCPCGENCPNGCENCDNPICFPEICDSPEINNHEYKTCIEEELVKQNFCIRKCPADEDCFSNCFETFLETTRKCPCMAGCPDGICPVETTVATTTTEQSTTTSIPIEETFLFVLAENVYSGAPKLNYIISALGDFSETREIVTPDSALSYHGFLERSGFAVLSGQVYLFGGPQNDKMIGKLEDCSVQVLQQRLRFGFTSAYGSVLELDNSALVCFGQFESTFCERFDGSSSSIAPATQFSHYYGCLANLNGYAVAVNGYESKSVRKVEILRSFGWSELAEHPRNIYKQSCVGVENGLLTLGGYEDAVGYYLKDVFLLRDETWSAAGMLQEYARYATPLKIGNNIFVINGDARPFALERVNFNGTYLESSEIFSAHLDPYWRPIVFQADRDFCAPDF